jgi:FtsP/CotA-like multicopper oxidase with cupredoxin domain
MNQHPSLSPLTRRTFIGAGLSGAALLALAACAPTAPFLSPTSQAVADAEAARKASGPTTRLSLRAGTGTLDLAGTLAQTWNYGSIPAPVIRLTKGDTLDATIQNALPEATTIHWHGLALRNDMDGVPGVTQDPIAAGASFRYTFAVPDAGTYWFHPHVGTQLDRGLYGALIVEDPKEPLAYDDEWVVVLDDWLDGVTSTPPDVFAELSQGMGDMNGMGGAGMRMGNLLMGSTSEALGGDAGDVYYPHYLINGRPPADPETFSSAPGKRVRIRMINAGADTAFRVALSGHSLTVTHTDGFPVDPVEVDSVLIGMGERYDVTVTLGDGAFAFVAEAEGKNARAFALVRTGSAATPPVDMVVSELGGRLGTADRLRAAAEVALPVRNPDREMTIQLRGSMAKYDWSLDGKPFSADAPMNDAHPITAGERVRINFVNTTTMWHPMHLHGHTYQHADGGPRKDTSIVLPGRTISVDFDANNPGRWITHCHNVYHAEAGMIGALAYTQ